MIISGKVTLGSEIFCVSPFPGRKALTFETQPPQPIIASQRRNKD